MHKTRLYEVHIKQLKTLKNPFNITSSCIQTQHTTETNHFTCLGCRRWFFWQLQLMLLLNGMGGLMANLHQRPGLPRKLAIPSLEAPET